MVVPNGLTSVPGSPGQVQPPAFASTSIRAAIAGHHARRLVALLAAVLQMDLAAGLQAGRNPARVHGDDKTAAAG